MTSYGTKLWKNVRQKIKHFVAILFISSGNRSKKNVFDEMLTNENCVEYKNLCNITISSLPRFNWMDNIAAVNFGTKLSF